MRGGRVGAPLAARRDGRRIIAVGTTSMRVLEHLALADAGPPQRGLLRGETRLFIRPGFTFRMVGGLVTNFHLPRTSLLALVMAFCGVDETRAVYRHAMRSAIVSTASATPCWRCERRKRPRRGRRARVRR